MKRGGPGAGNSSHGYYFQYQSGFEISEPQNGLLRACFQDNVSAATSEPLKWAANWTNRENIMNGRLEW